ncbi:ATP-binding protein [Streptomyces sp. SID12501]|uniref:ATP-binding protein n=1 Tax=Streptomyces sp. SID12501 TaxID=2706042 RepID=A0A6B3BKN8_9ACTN|nr:ATP-binding protein [Streptomyces sp. SID12501]NEC85195.1 ATP-binding protein [Streptomyces sp. SID12501]
MPEPTSPQAQFQPEPRQTATFRIPKHPRNVPDARAQVRKVLADWGLPTELAADIALVATEFVTNSVQHCEVTFSLVEVTLTLQDTQLLLEVSDPDKEKTPAPRTSGQHDENGRGLAVISALTKQWGYELRRFTKCSWATFPLPEAAPACSG